MLSIQYCRLNRWKKKKRTEHQLCLFQAALNRVLRIVQRYSRLHNFTWNFSDFSTSLTSTVRPPVSACCRLGLWKRCILRVSTCTCRPVLLLVTILLRICRVCWVKHLKGFSGNCWLVSCRLLRTFSNSGWGLSYDFHEKEVVICALPREMGEVMFAWRDGKFDVKLKWGQVSVRYCYEGKWTVSYFSRDNIAVTT